MPGSNYPLLNVDALNQLTNLPIFKVSLYVSFPLGPFLGGYFGLYAYNAGVSYLFTFVPVASALDVSPYTTPVFSQKYVNGANQNYPSSSQTFIAQETVQNTPSVSNNLHIRFTARNSRWMFNEMEGVTPNNENCSSECSPTLTITGDDLFCSTTTYSIPNLTSGTVTWTSSPANYISISPIGNGYQATANKINVGNVTITATTNCGQSVSKPIHVGGYSSSDYPVSGPSSACSNSPVYYSTNTLAGATSYTWFYPGNGTWTYQGGQNTPSLSLITRTVTGNFQVGVRVANICDAGGSYAVKNTFVNKCGSFAVVAEPNPTTGLVMVDLNDPDTNAKTNTSQQKIYEIRITDQYGIIQMKYRYSVGVTNVRLNLSNLMNGIYFIHAYNGTAWGNKKIILLH